jgi:alcohol dehydrogenase
MDALFHAAEGYLSTSRQPISDHLSMEAVRLIGANLPLAVRDGSNLEARTNLAWASCEAGICESLAGCSSHHSMEHAVSAYYPDVAHGAGLTMLSVSYFSYLAERNPARFPDLARAMGENIDGLSEKDQAMAFITGLKKLIASIGLDTHALSEYGIKKDDLPRFARNAFDTMGKLFALTPVELTLKDVETIYENAYA